LLELDYSKHIQCFRIVFDFVVGLANTCTRAVRVRNFGILDVIRSSELHVYGTFQKKYSWTKWSI